MRRVLFALMSTLAAVVALFVHRTVATAPATVATTTVAAATTGTTGATTPVQVQIAVAAGKITAATAVQVPTGNPRDEEINARAVPLLDEQAVRAQSADLDGVSGATVTSDGYTGSLQSAVDRAGL